MKLKRLFSLFLTLGFVAALGSGPFASSAQASSLKICGQVATYLKPTAVATGALTINGVAFTVGIGAALPASVAVGADLCADLMTNALGLVTGAAITADAHVHVLVCGDITAYAAATATSTGLLKIGSHTFTIGLGATLPASVHAGANLCLDLTLDGFGRVSGGSVRANASAGLSVCGTVTAYAAATATSSGSITVAGHSLVVAIGVALPASVHVGANLCLDLTLNGFGQVSGGSAIVNVTSTLKICGTVSAYVAATATSTGSITAGGHSLVIAVGASLPASVHVGADLCLDLTLNGFGQVSGGTAIANVTAALDVCGQVSSFTAATASNDGWLAVGSTGRSIAAATVVDSQVAASAFLKLHVTLDGFARISHATVVKVGVSVADACGSISDPGASTEPGGSPEPGTSTEPGSSPEPTAAPGESQGPDATSGPGGGGAGDQHLGDCTTGSRPSAGAGSGSDSLLPSTNELGDAGRIVASNAIPLIAIGLLGGLAAWYRSRRSGNAPLEPDPALATVSLEGDPDLNEHDGAQS
jgi:hypothetical protein